MKKILLPAALLLLALFSWNCEKDDICDEGASTTPRLIVQFYDLANPSIEKNVTNLAVIGDGAADTLDVFNGRSKIELPLKTTDDFTSYSFVLNSTNPALSNEDRIQFNYTRENIYVSRACGYKAVFDIDPSNPFIQTDGTASDGLWMQNITVNQTNIDNENETHISIYF